MAFQIDIMRLLRFILKHIWLPILCAAIGFTGMYYYYDTRTVDTYTASATMYVFNGNPNVINYQYTTMSDISAAVMLVDTYAVVVKSNKVLDAVAERLNNNVPVSYLAGTLSMSSVSETGVMKISCTTNDPQMSMDICNAVADIAPAEIIRVVNAGSAEVIDYATLPKAPNDRQVMRKGLIGGLAGALLGAGVLFLIFILNRKLADEKDFKENYDLTLLASIPKQPKRPGKEEYVIGPDTSSGVLASYGKLRMNVSFSLRDETRLLVVSSAVPGESKSILSANLAVSFAADGKQVLLIDGDMRKPTQQTLFHLDMKNGGLSDMLVSASGKPGELFMDVRPNLDVLPAGTTPPNPTELLGSNEMKELLADAAQRYDVIIVDTPPINVVPDALTLANQNAAMLFVTRVNYSDHREIKKALAAAELSGMHIVGAAMTCATRTSQGYYNYRYYKRYYGYYDKNHSHRKHDRKHERSAGQKE